MRSSGSSRCAELQELERDATRSAPTPAPRCSSSAARGAPLGLRRQRVPRLPGRDLGAQRRPLPPARGRGGARAGGAAHPRHQPLLHRAGDAAVGARCRRARSAARCSSATRAPRPTRRRSSSPAAPGRGGKRDRASRSAFHGRTYGALSATPQESKQAPFAPLVPGFVGARQGPRGARAAVDENTAAVLLEPIQGETGIHPLSDELLRAAREACDRTGAALDLRRDPDRHGAHRHAVGLRADPGRPRRDDQRQGARRRTADRCLITGPRLADVLAARRPRLDLRRWPVGRAAALAALEVCSRSGAAAPVRELGERLAPACASCRASPTVRGRGLMVGVDLQRGSRRRSWRGARCSSSGLSSTRPARRRSGCEPPLIVDRGRDRRRAVGALISECS